MLIDLLSNEIISSENNEEQDNLFDAPISEKNDEPIIKNKPQINREKIDLLKKKFNIIRKIKPLRIRKNKKNQEDKFDPNNFDQSKLMDMSSIWEKPRRDRTSEEKFYYKKESRLYHKYFFLYLSREIRRTRWTPRKELSRKFIITVLFIAFFAALFAILQLLIVYLFKAIKLS